MRKKITSLSLLIALLLTNASLYAGENSQKEDNRFESILMIGGGFQANIKDKQKLSDVLARNGAMSFHEGKEFQLGLNGSLTAINSYKIADFYSVGVGVRADFQVQHSKSDLQGTSLSGSSKGSKFRVNAALTTPTFNIAPLLYHRVTLLNLISLSFAAGPALSLSFEGKFDGSAQNLQEEKQKKVIFKTGLVSEVAATLHLSKNFGIGITASTTLIPPQEGSEDLFGQKYCESARKAWDYIFDFSSGEDKTKYVDFFLGAHLFFKL